MKKQIKFKNINMKHDTIWFVDDITNIKKFGRNNIKADEKSHKIFFYLLHWICNDQRYKICKN